MWKRFGKRTFDLVVSLVALVFLFPLLFVVAVLIRIVLGSPVLFRQERPGLDGKPFYIYKFRTMTQKTNADGSLLPDSERLTGLGRFLRTSSLDELPALLNVLRGEMSLVGPRPLLMQYLSRYSARQMRRHEVRPGITGWAQVNGRNAITWEQKFDLDVWYVDHQSSFLDIKILLLTLSKTLKRENISHPGTATMHEFMGSDPAQETVKDKN